MKRFSKILIANRGEIAVRIHDTAVDMGYRTVAVYSDADKNALHVSECSEAVRIGPSPVGESYLNIDRILEAAHTSGADAVHPGYGFLSENKKFQEALAKADITFIGPDAYAIEAMREALPVFGRKIQGYDMADAVLTGVETRTSSPLKLPRGEDLQSTNLRGLYPAGEGASYAGGILSAGVDGIKVAEALAIALTSARRSATD